MEGKKVEYLGKDGFELYSNLQKVLDSKKRRVLLETTEGDTLIGMLNNFDSVEFNFQDIAKFGIGVEKLENISLKPEQIRESYLIH